MRQLYDFRGIDCVWDDGTQVVSFTPHSGDPVPDATWAGPVGKRPDGSQRYPLNPVTLPWNFQESGFAEAVAEALENALDTE